MEVELQLRICRRPRPKSNGATKPRTAKGLHKVHKANAWHWRVASDVSYDELLIVGLLIVGVRVVRIVDGQIIAIVFEFDCTI